MHNVEFAACSPDRKNSAEKRIENMWREGLVRHFKVLKGSFTSLGLDSEEMKVDRHINLQSYKLMRKCRLLALSPALVSA